MREWQSFEVLIKGICVSNGFWLINFNGYFHDILFGALDDTPTFNARIMDILITSVISDKHVMMIDNRSEIITNSIYHWIGGNKNESLLLISQLSDESLFDKNSLNQLMIIHRNFDIFRNQEIYFKSVITDLYDMRNDWDFDIDDVNDWDNDHDHENDENGPLDL